MISVPLLIAAPDDNGDAAVVTQGWDSWYEFRWCAAALSGVCVILGGLVLGLLLRQV